MQQTGHNLFVSRASGLSLISFGFCVKLVGMEELLHQQTL